MLWQVLSAGKNGCTGKDANEAHNDELETLVKKRDEKKDLVDEEKEKKAENSTFTFS